MGRSQRDLRGLTALWERVNGVSTSTPHERRPRSRPAALQPPRSRPLGLSTGAWIVNGILLLALSALGVYAYTTLGSSGCSSAATRTATVQRGVVMTSVSASGSVASAGDVAANFQTSGTLTAAARQAGPARLKGQVLARVDSLSARQAVQEAEAAWRRRRAACSRRSIR